MTLPSATQLQINPADLMPKVDRATLRKRLFPPQRKPVAPVKTETAKAGYQKPSPWPAPAHGKEASNKPKRPNLSRQARYTAVIALLRQGVIQARIHEMTGVSRKKIRNVALSLGLPTDSRQFCDRHEAEIRRMYDEGVSLINISVSLGMAKNSAANYIRKKGWKR
jgi:hypothetical protein